MSSDVGPLPPWLYYALVDGFHDSYGIRYFSVIGLVILIYEYALTFEEEVTLVWKAPASFAKYAFLLNRYLVLASLLAINYSICGFNGANYTDRDCLIIFTYASISSVICTGLANFLVTIRVLILWDGNRSILYTLLVVFIACYSTSAIFLTKTLLKLAPGVQWIPIINTCAITTRISYWTYTWVPPFCFDILILVLTVINGLSRPRTAERKLSDTLRQDGILFFLASVCLAALNLAFTTNTRPSRVTFAGFFVWAMVNVSLNRLLLHIRYSEKVIELSEKRDSLMQAGFSDDDWSEIDVDERLRTVINLSGFAPFKRGDRQNNGFLTNDTSPPLPHVEPRSFFP